MQAARTGGVAGWLKIKQKSVFWARIFVWLRVVDKERNLESIGSVSLGGEDY